MFGTGCHGIFRNFIEICLCGQDLTPEEWATVQKPSGFCRCGNRKFFCRRLPADLFAGLKFTVMSEILRPELPLGLVTFRHVRDGIFIRQDDYYRKCLYTDLLWVETSGSYSDLHLRDRSRIVVALRIGVMDRYLPASHFVRIHRSFVVRLFDIDTFVGNSLCIGDKWFPIGRLYRPEVLALLNILNYVCRLPEDGG